MILQVGMVAVRNSVRYFKWHTRSSSKGQLKFPLIKVIIFIDARQLPDGESMCLMWGHPQNDQVRLEQSELITATDSLSSDPRPEPSTMWLWGTCLAVLRVCKGKPIDRMVSRNKMTVGKLEVRVLN